MTVGPGAWVSTSPPGSPVIGAGVLAQAPTSGSPYDNRPAVSSVTAHEMSSDGSR